MKRTYGACYHDTSRRSGRCAAEWIVATVSYRPRRQVQQRFLRIACLLRHMFITLQNGGTAHGVSPSLSQDSNIAITWRRYGERIPCWRNTRRIQRAAYGMARLRATNTKTDRRLPPPFNEWGCLPSPVQSRATSQRYRHRLMSVTAEYGYRHEEIVNHQHPSQKHWSATGTSARARHAFGVATTQ